MRLDPHSPCKPTTQACTPGHPPPNVPTGFGQVTQTKKSQGAQPWGWCESQGATWWWHSWSAPFTPCGSSLAASHIPDLMDVTQKPLPGKNTHCAKVLTGDNIWSGASRSRTGRKYSTLLGRMAPLTITTASLSFCYEPGPVLRV